MRDAHSGLIKFSCCACRRYTVSSPLCNSSSFVHFIPSLASSHTDFTSPTSAADTVSLPTIDLASCLKLPNSIISSFPRCPSFPLPTSSRCSFSSCFLYRVCCTSPSSATRASTYRHRSLFASLAGTFNSRLSRAHAVPASHSYSLPWYFPTAPDSAFMCGRPSSPRVPTFRDSVAQKPSLGTCLPGCTFRRCSPNTFLQVSLAQLSPSSSSFSLSPALSSLRLPASTGTAATLLAAATAIVTVAVGAAAVVSAAAATAAIPAATSAGSAVAVTAASAAMMMVIGEGSSSLMHFFPNLQLHRFVLNKSYALPSCSIGASKRCLPVSANVLPSGENSSPTSGAPGCTPLRKTGSLLSLSSSIFSTSDNLDSSRGSSGAHIAALVPCSRCNIASPLYFLSFPSSLQAALSIFRPIPTTTPASSSPPVDDAISVTVGIGNGTTGPPPTRITILTDQPTAASSIAGAAARRVSAVVRGTNARRLLVPFGVADGETKERRSMPILQGLKELLEELTKHFWKGNRWKGPQKNKWKWYHRHGYWATRKKLIDFTKYRRYGYHERYGMGRPKMKFWEDPSRYKRLRQAVRFW